MQPGYVNPANGNLLVRVNLPQSSVTDFLPRFTYNSLSTGSSSAGNRWYSSCDRYVEQTDEGLFLLTDVSWFAYEQDMDTGPWLAPPGATSQMQVDDSGGFTETQPDGTVLYYEPMEGLHGRFNYVQSKAGSRWTLSYFTAGSDTDYLSTITGPFSRITSLGYYVDGDDNYWINRVQDPNGRITSITVDGSQNLTRIISPELCITSLIYCVALDDALRLELAASRGQPGGGPDQLSLR